MRRLLALAAAALAAAALAVAAPAAGQLPVFKNGSSVGEGVPLKAYATITPTVHLFGDEITAKLAVIADTKYVDPARLDVKAGFKPYQPVRASVIRLHVGRFAQVTWTWELRCIASPCVPRLPPSEKWHVFHFSSAHISYLTPNGKAAYGLNASWPPVEVLSQISPGVATFLARTNRFNWRTGLTPVAAPTYRVSPSLVFWLALALAGAFLVGAAWFAQRWYLVVRPRRIAAPVVERGTPLERALAVLQYAHEHGDETLQRKAFERVAGELGVEQADRLMLLARELAWSARTPEDEEVEDFAVQARETQETDA
jgi:hypothetical protein